MKRIFLFFVFIFCFASTVYAVGHKTTDGHCVYMTYDHWGPDYETRSRYTAVRSDARFVDNMPIDWINPEYNIADNYYKAVIKGYVWNDTAGVWQLYISYHNGIALTAAQFNEMKSYMDGHISSLPATKPADMCVVPACDTKDDDNDGVCNACDKLPTAPDPQDCILGEAVGADGNLSGLVIDEGCTNIQDNFVYWGSDSFTAADKWVWHIGNASEQMGRQTCHSGGTEGNCCAYSEGSLGAQKTAGLAPAGAMPSPTVEQMVDDLTNLPAPEDLPSNCSGHNSQCEKMCQDKLGVGFSFCREDDITHQTTSQCKCNTDLNYEMATPQDQKNNPTDDKYDQDSNGNAVPDYADDSLLGQGDTDGDHITNKADADTTGGPDSNKDGIDDNYQATAKAVAQAGLSSSDSANLHDIETNTANTVASVNNLGTKIGKILDSMTAEQIENQKVNEKMTNMVDSFSDSNTPAVAGADDSTFGGVDESILPVDDSEEFDIDAYLAQFNYMSEMHDAIINSKVEISSADSCVDNTIHGSHVKFCFNMFENWFVLMGQILKALAVFRGFDIVVTGGRGFGG